MILAPSSCSFQTFPLPLPCPRCRNLKDASSCLFPLYIALQPLYIPSTAATAASVTADRQFGHSCVPSPFRPVPIHSAATSLLGDQTAPRHGFSGRSSVETCYPGEMSVGFPSILSSALVWTVDSAGHLLDGQDLTFP